MVMLPMKCWPAAPLASTSWATSPSSSKRSEEHTSELQSHSDLVCRLLLEKKKHKSELKTHNYLVCRLLIDKTISSCDRAAKDSTVLSRSDLTRTGLQECGNALEVMRVLSRLLTAFEMSACYLILVLHFLFYPHSRISITFLSYFFLFFF